MAHHSSSTSIRCQVLGSRALISTIMQHVPHSRRPHRIGSPHRVLFICTRVIVTGEPSSFTALAQVVLNLDIVGGSFYCFPPLNAGNELVVSGRPLVGVGIEEEVGLDCDVLVFVPIPAVLAWWSDVIVGGRNNHIVLEHKICGCLQR